MRDLFPLPRRLTLTHTDAMQRMEQVASSLFYLDESTNTLFKVVLDKYDRRRHPFKWLLRDVIEKRLLGRFAAFKEYRSNRIIRQAGLRAIECRGFGAAINLFNPQGSVYAMEFLRGGISGEAYFDALPDDQRDAFVRRMSEEVLQLARHGYCHRDLHYGNLMIDANGDIVWIDTYIRRLPRRPAKRLASLQRTLSATKLKGERHRRVTLEHLRRGLGLDG